MAPRKHHFRLPNLAPTRVDTGFCGEFSFSDVTTLEDLLNVMVQATKQVHQTSRPDAREIMFTGMVDGEVPLSPTMIPSAGRLTVEHARLISRDSQFQTVSRVGITAHHLDDITAALSFSYNASRESYAT